MILNIKTNRCEIIIRPDKNIKQNLKQIVSTNRYNKEIAGTTVVINGATYPVTTDRVGKTVFANLLQTLGTKDSITYKINGIFL